MENTIGYILCCQSPALFLLAIALLIRFFVRKGKARVRAVLSLIIALVCIAAGVVLYYQGLLLEYFTLRTLWQIRTAGWIGLAVVAALLLRAIGDQLYCVPQRTGLSAVRRPPSGAEGSCPRRECPSAGGGAGQGRSLRGRPCIGDVRHGRRRGGSGRPRPACGGGGRCRWRPPAGDPRRRQSHEYRAAIRIA